MKCKFKKGLTLIEVVVTIALIGLIMIPITSLFMAGTKSQAAIAKDFNVQSSVRLASQITSNFIKKSNAVFLHKNIEDVFTSNIYPKAGNTGGTITLDQSFINSSPKKAELEAAIEKYKGWNFTVMSSDGKELRDFTYHTDPASGSGYFKMKRIMDMTYDESNITFDVQYKMNNSYSEDKLLEFLILGKFPGDGNYVNIISEVESLNSLQVVDRGDALTPARVLFYRTDDRPIGYDAKAAVAMVLDVSGSMAEDMDGKNVGESRISILKKKSQKLLNSMGDLDIDITMVPFSNYAYNEWTINGVSKDLNKFYNIITEKSDLDDIVTSLKTISGTNVGDGIRRAYYRMKTYNDIKNEEGDDSIENEDATKYMILLMDGVPTFGSVYKTNYNSYSGKYSGIDFVTSNEEISDMRYSSSTSYPYRRGGWFNNIQYARISYGKYYEYVKVGSDTFITDKNNKSNNSISFYSGNGNSSDDDLSMGYIGKTSELLAGIKNIDDKKNLKVYVIGFSNVKGDRDKIETIKGLISPYVQQVTSFEATSDDELEKVFDGIRQTILEDFWHIYGPKEY